MGFPKGLAEKAIWMSLQYVTGYKTETGDGCI